MPIITYRKWSYIFSLILIAGSLLSIAFFGFKTGIDFAGGSLLEVSYTGERPSVEDISLELDKNPALHGYSIRPTGDKGYILRTPYLEGSSHSEALQALSLGKEIPTEIRFDAVGPTVGVELKTKALLSLALVMLAIVLFIAFAFRKVSEPVSSWIYGLVAITALAHDVIIPTGFFSIMGHFAGFEIDGLFVTALLVVLGFSVHDTIVVFDRVRENLRLNKEKKNKEEFGATVGKSVAQTFNRSINTSLTTVLALLALYFFGAGATQHFALALIVGIVAGTYSSIFLGSPLLVTIEAWRKK